MLQSKDVNKVPQAAVPYFTQPVLNSPHSVPLKINERIVKTMPDKVKPLPPPY